MTDVQETKLPGVGVRHDFETRTGRRVGVIAHHTGQRELLVYDERDPDSCRETLRLDPDDAHTLAELLGAAHVESQIESLRQSVHGLAIDWIDIHGRSAAAERTIGELGLRQRTGVTLIALVRGGEVVPSPGPDERLHADDTAVVVGVPDGIARAFALLRGE